MYYKLVITETGRGNLKDRPHMFNEIVETKQSLDEINSLIIERYGKRPNGKNKIYVDTKKGETLQVGFLHSFWTWDYSHNSAKWFQTDWITVTEVNEKPVLI